MLITKLNCFTILNIDEILTDADELLKINIKKRVTTNVEMIKIIKNLIK